MNFCKKWIVPLIKKKLMVKGKLNMYETPNHQKIRDDIEEILKTELPWESLSGKKIMVTGAAGMLPAYIVDILLLLPEYLKCTPPLVNALVRNRDKAEKRFSSYLNNPNFKLSTDNICKNIDSYRFGPIIAEITSPAPGVGIAIEGTY